MKKSTKNLIVLILRCISLGAAVIAIVVLALSESSLDITVALMSVGLCSISAASLIKLDKK